MRKVVVTNSQRNLPPRKENMERMAVESILDNSLTDFDLYLDVGDALTLYAKAPYKWEKAELSRLLAGGHSAFYYSISDRDKVEAFRALQAIPEIDLSLPPMSRVLNLTDVAAEMTRVLYEHPITASAIHKGEEVAQAMVDCIREDIHCIAAIGGLANHDFYTYYHSARVAAYATAIALQLSARDEDTLRNLAVGCLFHDVGKSKIELAVLNKRGAFTESEWDLMKRHPVLGDELISGSLLSAVPRGIVLHHHERFDGSGYPHGLTQHEMLEEVKIAAFADVFDALTTNRPYQVKRTRYEALDMIRDKMLTNLHKDSFVAMIEILGLDPATGKKKIED